MDHNRQRSNQAWWFWYAQLLPPLSAIPLLYKFHYGYPATLLLWLPYIIAWYISFITIFVRLLKILAAPPGRKLLVLKKMVRPILLIVSVSFMFILNVRSYDYVKQVLYEDALTIDGICKNDRRCPDIPEGWYRADDDRIVRDIDSTTSLVFKYSLLSDKQLFEICLIHNMDRKDCFLGGVAETFRVENRTY